MEALIVLAFSMTLLAFPVVSSCLYFARDCFFNGGPNLYTILLVCSGCGSIAGALIVGGVWQASPPRRSALLIC